MLARSLAGFPLNPHTWLASQAAAVSKAILPEIVALAEDPQWRVRLALIEQLPTLAKSIGSEQFDSLLTPLTMTWLTDHVCVALPPPPPSPRSLALLRTPGLLALGIRVPASSSPLPPGLLHTRARA